MISKTGGPGHRQKIVSTLQRGYGGMSGIAVNDSDEHSDSWWSKSSQLTVEGCNPNKKVVNKSINFVKKKV